jgi:hypothetical protein
MSLGALTLGVAATLAAVAWGSDASSAGGLSFDLIRGPGAESCPDEEALKARTAGHLARPLGSPRAPVADRVSIEIVRSERGYLATVSALGFDGGTRRLVDTGEDCAGLAEALTLMLSLIADGRPLPAAKPPTVTEPARPGRPWELGAGALGATGILGAPSLGITLDVIWHPWPRIASGITALWMPDRDIQKGQGQSQISLVAATSGRLSTDRRPLGKTLGRMAMHRRCPSLAPRRAARSAAESGVWPPATSRMTVCPGPVLPSTVTRSASVPAAPRPASCQPTAARARRARARWVPIRPATTT